MWIRRGWKACRSIGVTAGASAPEHLVEQIVAALQDKGFRRAGRSRNGGGRCAVFAAPGTGRRRSSQLYGIIGAIALTNTQMSSSTLPRQTDTLSDHGRANKSFSSRAEHLLSLQHPDGYWCALLTADTTLESDYILLQLWMHPPRERCLGRRPTAAESIARRRAFSRNSCPMAASTSTSKARARSAPRSKPISRLKLAGIPVDEPRR